MVNSAYIRKRKAKRIVALVTTICGVLALIIGAIALLGQRAAPLTITLTQSGAVLDLTQHSGDDAGKTFLVADDVPDYTPFSNEQFSYYEATYGNLDNENTYSQFVVSDNKQTSTKFFKYTFYVTNRGNKAAEYDIRLNISNPTKDASNRYEIDSILRVRFYENRNLDEHNYITYAKKSATPHIDEEGNTSYKELISIDGSGYAEPFFSNNVVLSKKVTNLLPSESIRYTFVFWLEGEDPECQDEPPVDSSLILGVEIGAHEASTNPSSE